MPSARSTVSTANSLRITALAGGVGAARFLRGVVRISRRQT